MLVSLQDIEKAKRLKVWKMDSLTDRKTDRHYLESVEGSVIQTIGKV